MIGYYKNNGMAEVQTAVLLTAKVCIQGVGKTPGI